MRWTCVACKGRLTALQRAQGRRFCSRACYHAWQRTLEGRSALAEAARRGQETRRARWGERQRRVGG